MFRAISLVLAALIGAASLQAAEVAEYNDTIFLYDHETVRYRLSIDSYGENETLHVDVYVRGISERPRARVLNSNYSEVKQREDTDGDRIIDFDFTAESPRPRYYIEIDSADPRGDSSFEVRIEISADEAEEASVDIDFQKVFVDYDDGGQSDHVDCAAVPGASMPWALGGLGALALLRRRRVKQSPAR
ncbi:MAG: hypothetical protein IT462_00075 [Planctomycetes bacterium]|nr:hypothetical protein [Planctomycetota bacterium]